MDSSQRMQKTNRYAKQELFGLIGEKGQQRISKSRVVLIGCGALGTNIANMLVRAGIGYLRICDRDYIDLDNLQRQILFDESDIEFGLPKAVAAAKKLRTINSTVDIEAQVTDVNHTNIDQLVAECSLILDGTDNFETRYLINDLAIRNKVPWVYGAVLGSTGLSMPILPGKGPCLRCLFETPPSSEISPTCETAGVISPAVCVVASLQVVSAMKILVGATDPVTLSNVDVWSGRVHQISVAGKENSDKECICCGKREFEYLCGKSTSRSVRLCGNEAIQVSPQKSDQLAIDLSALAKKLKAGTAEVKYNRYMLRVSAAGYQVTVFTDGRAIVKGARDPADARSIYARVVGS